MDTPSTSASAALAAGQDIDDGLDAMFDANMRPLDLPKEENSLTVRSGGDKPAKGKKRRSREPIEDRVKVKKKKKEPDKDTYNDTWPSNSLPTAAPEYKLTKPILTQFVMPSTKKATGEKVWTHPGDFKGFKIPKKKSEESGSQAHATVANDAIKREPQEQDMEYVEEDITEEDFRLLESKFAASLKTEPPDEIENEKVVKKEQTGVEIQHAIGKREQTSMKTELTTMKTEPQARVKTEKGSKKREQESVKAEPQDNSTKPIIAPQGRVDIKSSGSAVYKTERPSDDRKESKLSPQTCDGRKVPGHLSRRDAHCAGGKSSRKAGSGERLKGVRIQAEPEEEAASRQQIASSSNSKPAGILKARGSRASTSSEPSHDSDSQHDRPVKVKKSQSAERQAGTSPPPKAAKGQKGFVSSDGGATGGPRPKFESAALPNQRLRHTSNNSGDVEAARPDDYLRRLEQKVVTREECQAVLVLLQKGEEKRDQLFHHLRGVYINFLDDGDRLNEHILEHFRRAINNCDNEFISANMKTGISWLMTNITDDESMPEDASDGAKKKLADKRRKSEKTNTRSNSSKFRRKSDYEEREGKNPARIYNSTSYQYMDPPE